MRLLFKPIGKLVNEELTIEEKAKVFTEEFNRILKYVKNNDQRIKEFDSLAERHGLPQHSSPIPLKLMNDARKKHPAYNKALQDEAEKAKEEIRKSGTTEEMKKLENILKAKGVIEAVKTGRNLSDVLEEIIANIGKEF